ncbi:PGA biosynthesis protein capA [Proteiniborus sp. DW1]|uniref:CapA family protein n=1 Tax=Proteiniborus sp. DW1 TaxID=1889883 RepID=UPI00092E03D4|nr:CapA family protein [Proteiniborus sp. DW1]SCG81833.1 PGA biosynthesis protein capA [Proteiniborus sp. DW1]
MNRKKKRLAIILLIFILSLSFTAFSYAKRNTVTISIAGDTLLGDFMGNHIDTHGVDYPWESVKKVFQKSDLVLVNLECTVGTTGEPQDKQYTYRAKPETLQGLVNAGVKGVSLGNNHSLDYGRECFVETLDNLEKYNIKYTGGGRNIKDALEPAIWEINGLKIGFIGFSRVTPHVDWYATESRAGIVNGYDSNANNVIQAVKQAKEKVDFLIVSLHWGTELADYPRDNDVTIAKELIDNGADCIMGHHPHVLQGIEFYNNRPIVYSLGNFVFGAKVGARTSQTMIFNMEINKDGIINTSIVPGIIKFGKPTISEEDRETIISLINRLSADWGTKVLEDGNIVGNIEYVVHNELEPEENNQIENEEIIHNSTEAKNFHEENQRDVKHGKFSLEDFIDFLTEYGLRIFIISSILFVVLLVIMQRGRFFLH